MSNQEHILINHIKIVLERFATVMKDISGLASFFCMLLIAAAVCSRYFFSYEIPGWLELTQMMLVLIIFLPLAYVEKIKGHLQVQIILSKLPKKIQSILEIIWKTLACILFGLLAGMSLNGMIVALSSYESSWGDVAIPLWIPKLFIFLGCSSMFVYILISLIKPEKAEADKEGE